MAEIYSAFIVFADFLIYKSGVYKHEAGDVMGGYIICILIYGVENGAPYWLPAWSWNIGVMMASLKFSEKHCGIESEIVAGIPCTD